MDPISVCSREGGLLILYKCSVEVVLLILYKCAVERVCY